MTKPKIPIYPRPVSPLTAEPVQSNHSDIFLDDSTDSDLGDEQRASKRRRIEKLGEQYLRGDGLFIMTAGLKGPLTGWVNPWSKKHRQELTMQAGTSRGDTRVEVPETALKAPGQCKSVVSAKAPYNDVTKGKFCPGVLGKRQSVDDEKWLKMAQDCKHYTSNGPPEPPSPTPMNKRGKVRNLEVLIPTKKVRHLMDKPQARPFESHFLAANLEQSSADEKFGPTPTLSADNGQESLVKIRSSTRPQPFCSDAPAAISTANILPMSQEPHVVEHGGRRHVISAAEDTVLEYDLKSKKKSVAILPPLCRPAEFEHRPMADLLNPLAKNENGLALSPGSSDATKKRKHLDSAVTMYTPSTSYRAITKRQACMEKHAVCTTGRCDGTGFHVVTGLLAEESPVERFSMSSRKMPPPSLSTESSTTTNTNAIPSAQVVPALQQPSAESYFSTAGKMIEPEVTRTENKFDGHELPSAEPVLLLTTNQDRPHTTRIANATTPDAKCTSSHSAANMQYPRNHERITPFSAFKSPPACTVVAELDTQQMLAAITPLGFSTVKKLQMKPTNEQIPATGTQETRGEQKTGTSFTPPGVPHGISSGSSQGSIKACLRVSKLFSRQTKIGESLHRLSQPSPFGKLGLDMETSDEEVGSKPQVVQLRLSPLVQGEPSPRDVPIPSRSLPTANTLRSSGLSQQQDAQQDDQQELGRRREDGQNVAEGRDEFNLASAIDDLGSFLGTWDADKEARQSGSITGSSCVKSA